MPEFPRGVTDFVVAGTIVSDQATGLSWARSPAPSLLSWDAGLAYCESADAGWRLPTAMELATIVDLVTPMAGVSTPFNTLMTPATDTAWSSSRNSAGQAAAFNPSLRDFVGQATTTLNTVRCVRSTEVAPTGARFSVDGGVFFDARTGWSWRALGSRTGRAAAAAACTALDAGWRLPHVSEATSLLRFPGVTPHHLVPVPVMVSWWTADGVPSTNSGFAVQANNANLVWVDPSLNTFEALCINAP